MSYLNVCDNFTNKFQRYCFKYISFHHLNYFNYKKKFEHNFRVYD